MEDGSEVTQAAAAAAAPAASSSVSLLPNAGDEAQLSDLLPEEQL